MIELPPGSDQRWSVRGYYGTVSHNVKAVYQRYLSWYDGNPCNLHALPPAPAARKFVEYMGGAGAVIARAQDRLRQRRVPLGRTGDEGSRVRPAGQRGGAGARAPMRWSRWATRPKSATWRNAFLYGAQELRHGVFKMPGRVAMGADTLAGLSTDGFFDAMAIRLDPSKAAGQSMIVNWRFTDRDETMVMTLRHCTMTHRLGEWSDNAHASITTTRAVLDSIVLGKLAMPDAHQGGPDQDRGRADRACRPVRGARSAG